MLIIRASKADITRIVTLIKNHYGNVENKSGATIRSEMTKQEVTNALGYTPIKKIGVVAGTDIIE